MSDIAHMVLKENLMQRLEIPQPKLFIPYPQTERKSEPDQRLKLKDYLRLKTINKRSSSANRRGQRTKTPDKAQVSGAEKRPIDVLKQQLLSDLKTCSEKLTSFISSIQKSQSKLENASEQYEELVYLCELHRVVKQSIETNLDKVKGLEEGYLKKQREKLMKNSFDLLQESSFNKSTSPNRKRSLFLESRRSGFKLAKNSLEIAR